MANKIATVCKYPLCKKINCTNPDHMAYQQQRQCRFTSKPDKRPSAARRGYDYKWQMKRKEFIKRHPYCEDCGAPTTDVDHIPDRNILVAQGVPDPDDDQYLHARCHSCHSKKTYHNTQMGRG